MKNSRRVVITGLGVVSPIGIGKEIFWTNLIAGKSGVDYVSSFDAVPFPCRVAAEVRTFDSSRFMSSKAAKRLSRCSQLSVAAARLALEDAGLGTEVASKAQRVGVCFGTSVSGISDIGENNHRAFLATRAADLNPMAMLEFPAHAATSHVARELSVSGPSTTIASGCASGLDAVLWGASEIGRGRVDMAIVGAADAPITEFIFSLFSAGNFLATWEGPPSQASRPYDLLRSGLVLAEASAALILEEMDHAHERNATIHGEVVGTGSSSEGGFAGRAVEVYRQSLEAAMAMALGAAGKSSLEIDHINSHGNSTKTDDAAETAAFKDVLGEHAYRVPITSIKGAVGQPLAAGGILQIASAALSITSGHVPPTINQEHLDPECDLDYVPNHSRIARVRNVLVHSHSLGGYLPGSHTAIVISAPPI
jgi:3-oxoacyl-[acyl-carrier-protein] synthase II